MIRTIDNLLNSFTMYRVVLYGLAILAGVSILLGFTGTLFYTPIQLITSLVILIISCYITNSLFARLLKIPTNVESFLITAFILFFLLLPPSKITDIQVLVFASVLAMASKYIFAFKQKHIFNPAAIAAFLLGVLGSGNVIWWIGSDVLLPFTLVIGLLIVRKIRRFHLLFSFLAASLVTIGLFSLHNGVPVLTSWVEAFKSWPLIFFATVMLTEPLTTPPTKKLQLVYGVLVGALFGAQFQVGPIYSTPELALIVGNLFSYIVSPQIKVFLRLQKKTEVAEDTYEFVFQPDKKISFHAGQYLEWTLPHKSPDSRGNRRYFTIASSPTENVLKLVIRANKVSSSFKKKLLSLQSNEVVVASQLAGDFTLPSDKKKKLVFIAGGIGVTPFLSMVKYLLDSKEKYQITLLYVNKKESDIAYKDFFNEAANSIGMKVVYVLTDQENLPKKWTGQAGRVNDKMIQTEIPDYKERVFYLSGPSAMVDAHKHLLAQLGVSKKNIVTDYFPGF
jgi:ferredoxin-NADP reductase/Na+-transporting NADH:ubiquinone oxidoreductase subunit NqrB